MGYIRWTTRYLGERATTIIESRPAGHSTCAPPTFRRTSAPIFPAVVNPTAVVISSLVGSDPVNSLRRPARTMTKTYDKELWPVARVRTIER